MVLAGRNSTVLNKHSNESACIDCSSRIQDD